MKFKEQKICNYFKVKLFIIDFDYYKSNKTKDPKLFNFLFYNQLASITSINHWYLAKYVKTKFGTDCSVFCGEISDGAHNLGFSQYVLFIIQHLMIFESIVTRCVHIYLALHFLNLLTLNKT